MNESQAMIYLFSFSSVTGGLSLNLYFYWLDCLLSNYFTQAPVALPQAPESHWVTSAPAVCAVGRGISLGCVLLVCQV